jgi:sigma-54 specific flagellar transcriptional regulator A
MTRQGLFEMAHGGTLFLDELGELPLDLQPKLLRALEQRQVKAVGGQKEIPVDVRIIAATHRDLEAAINDGRFREDLYYRLNVFPLQMPPLRERLDDLPVLIEHLVQRQGTGPHIQLDAGAMTCLSRNRWPGNVRELSNLLERLAILYPARTVTAADLPERYRNIGSMGWLGNEMRGDARTAPIHIVAPLDLSVADSVSPVPEAVVDEMLEGTLPRGGIDLKDHLSAIEVGLIRKALEEADGTVAGAARLLRMRRTTLVEKLRKYRLSAA